MWRKLSACARKLRSVRKLTVCVTSSTELKKKLRDFRAEQEKKIRATTLD
jgi:hypothetical protein